MRVTGKLSGWDDAKGYGFVIPIGGGERAFVHITQFQHGQRRPCIGDLITYVPHQDERGRMRARDISHADQKFEPRLQPATKPASPKSQRPAEKHFEPRRQTSRLPRTVLGVLALASAYGAAAMGRIPYLLVAMYCIMSVVSYVLYFIDKRAAEREAQRTPENDLHLADLLGGWPGALIAQQQFRHKTIKQPFQSIFWMSVVVNLAGMWWLVSSGKASMLSKLLVG